MAQPSGRVLSLPAKYRTYLRFCPVICAADSLSIFIHFLLYSSAFPFQEAIQLLIYERFSDDEKDEEGIQAIEKLTFIRWMFFVFGSAGPGIKLMAMENLLWTKAWGAMFLVSFIVVESLVILSWIYGTHEALPAVEGHEAAQLLRIKRRLQKVDRLLYTISVFLYSAFLEWVAVDIYDEVNPYVPTPRPTGVWALIFPFLCVIFIGWGMTILPILLFLVLFIFWPTNFWLDKLLGDPLDRGFKTQFAASLLFRLSFLILLVLCIFGLPRELIINAMIASCFAILLSIPGLMAYGFWKKYAERWPRFSRSVFITWESAAEVREREREGGARDSRPGLTFRCFLLFLYSTLLCAIWYAYRYNPEGTVNRGWTGVFG